MLTKDFIEIEADSREEVLNEILNDQNSELFINLFFKKKEECVND